MGEKMVWLNPPMTVGRHFFGETFMETISDFGFVFFLLIVPLTPLKVLCFSFKTIDVFSKKSGTCLQASSEVESKKVRFLLKQFDDREVVITSKSAETSNIHIIRPVTQRSFTISGQRPTGLK